MGQFILREGTLLFITNYLYSPAHFCQNQRKYVPSIHWPARCKRPREGFPLLGSLKLLVSFAEYCLFYRALFQKRHIILRSLMVMIIRPFKISELFPLDTDHGTAEINRNFYQNEIHRRKIFRNQFSIISQQGIHRNGAGGNRRGSSLV